MKIFKTSILIGIVSLATSLLSISPAAAEIYPPEVVNTANFTNVVASASSITNQIHRANAIPPGKKILVLQGTVVAANAGVSNVTATINTTLDSTMDNPTGWLSTAPYTAAWTLNGTNPVTASFYFTNIPSRYWSIDKWATTQTNAVTISNLRHFYLDN